MKLSQLRYFVSLAQTGTFSEAADRVHVSQPALSQQIKKLEEELGSPLVERMGKRVKLTESGEKFLPEVMNVLDSVRSATESIDGDKDSLNGSLRLGIIPTIAPYFLPSMMEKLNLDPNSLDIHIEEQQTDTLIEQLKMGEVDHLLLSPPIPEDGLITNTVGNEPFQLAVADDDSLADRRSISLDEITQEPVLLLEKGHCLRDQSLSFCERQNVQPNVVFQGSTLHSILKLVETGYGYTFVPRMVAESRQNGSVTFVSFKEPRPHRDIVLVRRKSTRLTQLDETIYEIVEDWFND